MDGERATFSGIIAQDNVMAVHEARAWIEAVTGDKLPYDDFRQSLESGVVLCEFMEKLRPNSIGKINRRASAIAHLDNIRQFLQACKTNFKLRGDQLFEITDLQDVPTQKPPAPEGIRREADRKLRNVCVTLYWLGRTMSSKVDYVGPQLCLEAFQNMMSAEDGPNSSDNHESLQEVTVHMTTSNGGFGFQIVGGHDCSVPATVDRVVVGGTAESRGLQPNDIIVSLNGENVTQLSHLELIRLIKQSGSKGSIVLGLLRKASFRAEFSPSSDGNYPSSGGSPLPNKAQSPQNNFEHRTSDIAKSELLVHTARTANKVYVGDSSGEDSDTARREEWSEGSLKNNQEEEERLKKLQNDQELRRRQEEEMAQVYPAKYSRVNGGSGSHGDVKVFNTYGDNLSSPLIRAHIDYSTHLQIEKELNSVSKATPRLRQKWQSEETRAVTNGSSPVSSRKHSYDNLAVDRERTSAGQDDKAALEEQLRKLQLEAQLAREEAEALKREKAEDEARIRHEEQMKYQEELKRQSMDAQQLLAELQRQQLELQKKQESLMQATNSFTDIDKERVEIRQQLEEQRKAILDQWQQLDQERQLMEEKRHLMRLEEEQRKQLGRQKELQQQELERLLAEKERREQELQQNQEEEEEEEEEERDEQQQEEGHRVHVQKRDSWKILSEVTQLPPEVEQRREMERQAEMKRQMERLQKKEKHKSSSNGSYNHVSPSASWSSQNNASAMNSAAVHVTKPVQTSVYNMEFCSSCAMPLGSERAMSITSLGLLYHLKCFICCVCHAPLATGLERTHVHVRNSRPHCKFCYSTDTGLLATEC